MQNIRLNNKVFYGPANWDELDAGGLLHVAAITGMQKFKAVAPYYLVMKLFNVPVGLFKKLRQSQMILLETCLDWMSEKNNITQWLIPRIKIKAGRYYGPKDRLADLTVEEFMYAEAAYTKWLKTNDPNHLKTLFAALYRTRSFFFNKRKPFITGKDKAERDALNLRPHVLTAIALNYAGCRNFIISKHPHVWKPAPLDEQQPLLKKQDLQQVNWVELALESSGDKFGTYNQTIQMNLWIFLADMDKKVRIASKPPTS